LFYKKKFGQQSQKKMMKMKKMMLKKYILIKAWSTKL